MKIGVNIILKNGFVSKEVGYSTSNSFDYIFI